MKRLLVTAGPTREMLDPVRFLSNLSTGEMGYQIALEGKRRGYRVTLISGPTAFARPKGTHFIPVISTQDMEHAVRTHFPKCDALVMTAAVCDYTPVKRNPQKIKRIRQKTILFKRTRDILKSIASQKGKRYVVGFCLETENLEQNAIRKLQSKSLDLIVANAYGKSQNPFGPNKVSVMLIDKSLKRKLLPKTSKNRLAKQLIAMVDQQLRN